MAYVVETIEGPDGSAFWALSDEDSINLNNLGPESVTILTLLNGWLYTSGIRPSFQAASVRVAAEGTTILAQIIPDEDMPAYKTVRIILLEGGPLHVSKLDGGDDHPLTDPGTFIDARVRIDGAIVHWSEPDAFDPENTPGSEGLMGEVDAARSVMGVP